MSDDKPGDSVPELAGALARAVVPRWTLMLGGFALGLLFVGGAAVWAADAHIDKRTAEGVAPEAKARESLEERFESHVVESRLAHTAQAKSQERTEAKVDRVDQRLEQVLDRLSQMDGRPPPPPPPLVLPDGGGTR